MWKVTMLQSCEIAILISRFNDTVLRMHSCDNGSIVGWPWNLMKLSDSDNKIYTSRLKVTVTSSSDVIGRNISCYYDNGTIQNPAAGSLKLIKAGKHSYYNSMIILMIKINILFIIK